MSNSGFHAKEKSVPMVAAIKGAVAALNTSPAFGVPSLGVRVTSYHVVRHVEAAGDRADRLLAAAELVIARWERGDLAAAVRELDAAIADAKGEAA